MKEGTLPKHSPDFCRRFSFTAERQQYQGVQTAGKNEQNKIESFSGATFRSNINPDHPTEAECLKAQKIKATRMPNLSHCKQVAERTTSRKP
ncbi:MAG: hypothetical protein ACH0QD_00060 [Tepidibacillus sp.]